MAEDKDRVTGVTIRISFAKAGLKIAGMLPDSARVKWSASKLALLPRKVFAGLVGLRGPGLYRIEAGPMKGLMIKTDLREYRGYILGTYEPAMTTRITELVKPGMTCMDIGAHHGYYTMLISLFVGEDGRVYSFEPDAENFSYMVEAVRANGMSNVECHNVAVRESSGRFALYHEKSSSTHKVLPLSEMDRQKEQGLVEIGAVSVDDFLKERGIEKLDFVKIDVEGSEDAVLAGMVGAIDALAPIVICEFHSEDKLDEGCSILKSRNYTIGIFRERPPFWVIAKPLKAG